MNLSLSLPADALWQSFMALRVNRNALLKFTRGNLKVTGYVTGLDEDWLQICTRAGLSTMLISLSGDLVVEETGILLANDDLLSEEEKKKVLDYSSAIRSASKNFLAKKRREREERDSRSR